MDNWGRWAAGTVQLGQVDVITEDALEPPRRTAALILLRNAAAATRYSLHPHGAAWRSLGDVMQTDDYVARSETLGPQDVALERVERFLRFYGPLYNPDQDAEPFASGALSLASACRTLAQAWAPPAGGDDLSRYDPARLDHHVNVAINRLRAFVHHPRAHEPEFDNLMRHLAERALAAQTEGAPMRPCRACGFWLIASRTDRFYCDAACRMHAREGRGERGRFRSSN